MAAAFTPDADWKGVHPSPSRPTFTPPPGSVDAHCHVFGPGDEFPYAPERKYTPIDAGKEKLFALRNHLGLDRNVVVQATCHGADNRAMVDAVVSAEGRARGVATIRPGIDPGELRAMHEAGVRGIRFNFVSRLVDPKPDDYYRPLVELVADLGWHVVLYFEAADLAARWELFTSLPITLVVDHLGVPDVTKPADGPDFNLFVRFMAENENVYSKVSCPERLSKVGPPLYDDVRPFARHVIETFPDRVLWGTDWPHPNMKQHMPDDGALVDLIPLIATTPDLQRRLLVDNPMRLYWEH